MAYGDSSWDTIRPNARSATLVPSMTCTGHRGRRDDFVRFAAPRLVDVVATLLAWSAWGLLQPDGVSTATRASGIAVALAVTTWSAGRAPLNDVFDRGYEPGRAFAIAGIAVLLAAEAAGARLSPSSVVLAALAAATMATLGRSALARWCSSARRSERFVRRAILVGPTTGGSTVRRLLESAPDSGLQIVGSVGDPAPDPEHPEHARPVPWLGPLDQVEEIIERFAISVAVVAPGALPPPALRTAAGRLAEGGTTVALAPDLDGIDPRRLRIADVSRSPLVMIDGPRAGALSVAAKRALDLGVASIALVLTAPVIAIVAVIMKVTDPGPILFRQTRVGRDGRHFTLLKLRTMTVDAEDRIIDLRDHNERHGPLFKLRDDPRVTRLGRLLRLTSIDELPQLANVLRGEMSMVGPRPALPDEVAVFPDALLDRHRVRPGLTGLWQVEARDDPAFSVYEELDLYYVHNWSLRHDLAILAATVPALAAPLLRAARRRRSSERSPEPAEHLGTDDWTAAPTALLARRASLPSGNHGAERASR